MEKETHRIVVALKSGQTLETRESFDEHAWNAETLLDEIFEDRTSVWKVAGDITFRFGELAAIQIEEL